MQKELPHLFLVMKLSLFANRPPNQLSYARDPDIARKEDPSNGLERSSNLAYKIVNEVEIPLCCELPDTVFLTGYIDEYLSCGLINPQYVTSRSHRDFCSSSPFPICFSCANGSNPNSVFQSIVTSRFPQTYCSINEYGELSIIKSAGNPFGFSSLSMSGNNSILILNALVSKGVKVIANCTLEKDPQLQMKNIIYSSKIPGLIGFIINSDVFFDTKPLENKTIELNISKFRCNCLNTIDLLTVLKVLNGPNFNVSNPSKILQRAKKV